MQATSDCGLRGRLTVRDGVATVSRVAQLVVGAEDDVEDLVLVLAGGGSVGDGDDDDGLLELAGAGGVEHEGLDDLVHEVGAERGETRELDLLQELHGLLLVRDVVALHVRVHEADLDTVVVEERSRVRDTAEDAACQLVTDVDNSQLQVVNALAVLLELHRAGVIDVEDDIEKRKLDL